MNKLLTNFPVTLTEEQKNVLKLTLSAVLEDDPITKYWRPTVYENGDIMWALVASESEPLSQNIKGPSGFTPQFQIDQSTAEWQVTYDGTNWTPLGIIASGAQGPQGNPGQNGTNGTNGKDGTDGKDGTSVYLKSVTDAQGGKQVTLGWGTSDTSAFVIPSGAAGTPGTDGFSPTVATSVIEPTSEHPQGGTSVTITDKTGPNQFNVWNGINGQGATVNLFEGTGIHITEDGTNYTISVSADYALKSYANEASANALSEAETWVTQKNFATSAGLDASKQYAMTTNGWSDFTIPSIPDITPSNGLSANGHTVGISNAGIDADKQYAWTQQGWTDFDIPSTSGYLPLSGGTVSGSVKFSVATGNNILAVASAASLIGASRQTSGHYGQDNTALGTTWFGVGGPGMHQGFIKYTDGGNVGDLNSNSTIQVNLKPSTNKYDSVQVQINGNEAGYLIPAQIHHGSYTPSADDGILHIIVEN